MAQQVLTVLREGEAARGALDQTDVEMRLEGGDLAGDRGLRGSYLSRHCGEGAGFGHAHETSEGTQ